MTPMSTSSVDRQIQDRIQSFVAELSGLVRRSAVEAVQAALGGGVAARRCAPHSGGGGEGD